jgi:hypothetical protein
MPITFFRNDQGTLGKHSEMMTGWWNCIAEGDFDNDGDKDYLAGNLGLNSVLKAKPGEPVTMYSKDFDGNGSIDPFISRYIQGKEYPIHYRETMTDQVVALRRKLASYASYGRMEMKEILEFLGTDGMTVTRVDHMESSYIENLGNGEFSVRPLAIEAQVSPANCFVVCDINADGKADFLAVGNSYSEDTLSGYYDAGIGLCALGNGDGTFTFLSSTQSGLCIRSDAKAIVSINVAGEPGWIVSSNNAPLQLLLRHAQAFVMPKGDVASTGK